MSSFTWSLAVTSKTRPQDDAATPTPYSWDGVFRIKSLTIFQLLHIADHFGQIVQTQWPIVLLYTGHLQNGANMDTKER